MSYILDSLRKADQERSIGDVPDLETPHWSQRRAGRTRYWLWAAIGLLLINGVLLAFLFNRDDDSESVPVQVQGKPGMRSQVPDSAPQREVLAKPVPPKPVPLKPLARPQRKVITRLRVPAPAVAERKPATADSGNVAAVSTAPLAQNTEPVQRSEPEIPELNELSLEFRSSFDPPRMDVHVYSDDPARRFILVDLKRFVEGDTLDSGVKLEKIQPESIQLYYQGTRFRYDR